MGGGFDSGGEIQNAPVVQTRLMAVRLTMTSRGAGACPGHPATPPGDLVVYEKIGREDGIFLDELV